MKRRTCSTTPSNRPTNFKDEYVSTEHLLLGIAQLKRDPAQEILSRMGATYDDILSALTACAATRT